MRTTKVVTAVATFEAPLGTGIGLQRLDHLL